TAFAGGIAAAGAIVAPSVRNQMTYEQRLASMANTAFAEQNTAGRRTGMRSMDQLIRRSVAVGGGSKETAADTLDTLLASGAVDYTTAEKLLPMLQKYATATEADPKELAQIAIRLKQSFGISDNQIPTALNMVIKSGQLGSFEIKNLAKWLPQQLAAANALGMNGLGDLAVLLGFNQASMISAGSPDEAGNNIVNLLTKINSQDAANSAARIKFNGKGIDLPGTLVRARSKGFTALEAFSGLTDKIVANNPEYQALEKQLKSSTTDSARQEIMQSQAKILEGSAIGQIIADRQALMALVAWRANRQYGNDVIKGVNQQRVLPLSQQSGEQNFDLIKGTNFYKVNQLNNTRDFAQMDAIQPLSDVLGKLSGELNDYAGAYPGLTKALAGAETAIKAMTAAAWAFAGIKFLSSAGAAATAAGTTAAGAGT
ncbi:phage tail tape measure protein, partial [Escherichia coli]